ncbi:M48 family metalloprotease [candidate division KSB1 bacterium]|nr:M48 family metalloprotease [candidate division KSB1 bacterium]
MNKLQQIYYRQFSIIFLLILYFFPGCAGNSNRGKLDFITFEEETFLGQELVKESKKQLPLIQNPEISSFLEHIANEIGENSEWKGLNYSVFIVDLPDYNHFSLPGGSIYLFRGLIELASNVNEVALIIAHEIAHIASRDAIDRISEKYSFALAAQSVMGNNPEIPKQIVATLYSTGTILDYPEEAELLADIKAVQYAWKTNYDPTGLVNVLEKINIAEKNAPELVKLLNYTHPFADTRFKAIQPEISRLVKKNGLIKDLPEFNRIKELLKNSQQ